MIDNHFPQMNDRYDILPHIYEKFEKNKIAKLCVELAACRFELRIMLIKCSSFVIRTSI